MIEPAWLLARLGIATTLKGRRLHAPCPHPDHIDRHPSWAAWRDDRGFRHRCLSCGFGGGAVGLVMAVLGVDAKAAGEWLSGAEEAAPPPPLVDPVVVVRDRRPPGSLAPPPGVTFEPFAEWPDPATRYLKRRGLGAADVERWGLGVATDGDVSRRVWIPVADARGDLQGWTARSYAKRDPKYLSSPYRSGALLGERLWGDRRDVVVVVEGPFDAMAVDAVFDGLPVAGLRGSDLDPAQARKLAGFDLIVSAVDPDAAGDKAARLLDGLGRWSRVRRAELPGVDCAELFATDPDRLAAVIGDACAG